MHKHPLQIIVTAIWELEGKAELRRQRPCLPYRLYVFRPGLDSDKQIGYPTELFIECSSRSHTPHFTSAVQW
jgi:hypothetical protein